MSKVAVVFWSGTGNTEAMANAVGEGAGQAGAERLAPGGEVELGPGTPVGHRSFGPGVARSLTGTIAQVDFETAGRRRVDLSACLKKGLLRRR